MPANAVEIRGLEKRFPGFTLGPIDLTVPVGSVYGFVGPNGAGKTTTFDLIFGLGGKDGGSIRVLGLDHARDEVAVKRQAAYVSAENAYVAWHRVGRAINFVRGFYPTWDEPYANRLLEMFKLHRGMRLVTLSTGARMKFALVLALAWRPKVIVLDEPAAGLDAISKQEVFGELLAAVGEGDRTVLMSSHNLTDVERIADHVGMIRRGRMVFEGATADVVERYRMVDVISPAQGALHDQPGIVVQRTEGDRARVLLDRRASSLEQLRSFGATCVADTPVTLEDLFVALGRESK